MLKRFALAAVAAMLIAGPAFAADSTAATPSPSGPAASAGTAAPSPTPAKKMHKHVKKVRHKKKAAETPAPATTQ